MMTQNERRLYLIEALLDEQPKYRNIEIPQDDIQQKQLLRSLFNVRMPSPISEEFLIVQDEYLKEETVQKGITKLSELSLTAGIPCFFSSSTKTSACFFIPRMSIQKSPNCGLRLPFFVLTV